MGNGVAVGTEIDRGLFQDQGCPRASAALSDGAPRNFARAERARPSRPVAENARVALLNTGLSLYVQDYPVPWCVRIAPVTIQRHMFVQLLVAALVVTGVLSGILTLGGLFRNVPTAVLYSRAILPVALGVLPINVYNALPIGVAVAAAWYYTNLVADHAVDVLYAAGFSYFSVILPALVLALLAATVGFYLSFVEAPRGWGRLLDAIYIGTHNVDPSNLDAQRFYALNDNSRTFYFGRWLNKDEIAEVFMRDIDDGSETSISAPIGEFVKVPSTTFLYLREAVVETRKAGQPAPRIIKLNELWINTGLRGSATPERNATYLPELGPVAFAAAHNQGDAHSQREWIAEAFKRTIPPILTITYVLVGIRLAFLGLGGRQETSWKLHAICAGIIVHHVILFLAADGLISQDIRMAWLIVAVIAIEIGIGILISSGPAHPETFGLRPAPKTAS
jgi:lipopolysaccharide export LptBFGC system permease protein LptF